MSKKQNIIDPDGRLLEMADKTLKAIINYLATDINLKRKETSLRNEFPKM